MTQDYLSPNIHVVSDDNPNNLKWSQFRGSLEEEAEVLKVGISTYLSGDVTGLRAETANKRRLPSTGNA